MTEPPALVSDPRDVTAGWLTDLLRHAGALSAGGRVADFSAVAIGTGSVGATLRYQLRYGGDRASIAPPPSIVMKFASAEANSRAAGVATRSYENEVAFYLQAAHTVDVRRPHCYFAAVEPNTANVVVVLSDLAPAVPGDQLIGCGADDAELAVTEAARLHGPRWGDPALLDLSWLAKAEPVISVSDVYRALWDGFVERYRTTIEPDVITQGEALGAGIDRWLARRPTAVTITHGDFRIDNMMFEGAGRNRHVTIVDWQTARLGTGPADIAYLLGGSLPPDIRRAHEADLVRRYHDALGGYGVTGAYPFEECWDDYRRFSWNGLVMSVIAAMMVRRDARTDAMFATLANRHATQTRDLTAIDYLR